VAQKKMGRTIREKAARMPEMRELEWDRIVPAYIESIKALNSESAKSHRFTVLLNNLFGIQPDFIEDYVAGIEKYVKVRQKDRILRGRVDNLFGNLVIEFERNLTKTGEEAEDQLKRYIACLWSQEPPRERASYLGITSDGINFAVYSPTVADGSKAAIEPDEIQFELLETVDLNHLKPQEVYFWLDRYFLRKEILSPRTENVVKDFGVKSHAFRNASSTLLALWKGLKSKSEFDVVYENWEKYLRIVYGSSVAEEELFIRHTYLATLAKLLAWTRLVGGESSPDNAQILSVLEGQFFKDNIENFLEEDFFSWVARKEAQDEGVEVARRLLSLLRNYNLRELSEDVLKSLYQELVDPRTRHDLGEYYTPDWLAHRIVRKLLEEKPEGSLLDPACGSGTFLYLAIREKRDRLGDSVDTFKHILSSIVGVDVHPLAVIIAKTNYILALGDLIKKRKGKISIPIYLSNTLRLPQVVQPSLKRQIFTYQVEFEGVPIYLPETLLVNSSLYDEAIDAAKGYAERNAWKPVIYGHFLSFLKTHHAALTKDETIARTLFCIAETLKSFIESKRDTIWAFVLKNTYKPLFLKGKFDFVVGNPPWLSYRYVEQIDYYNFLKKETIEEYGLFSGRVELMGHMELGILFFLRAADLYLKGNGVISFVLPKSIFYADQHNRLREGGFKRVNLIFRELWDLEEVKPLFEVPACVLLAQKESRPKFQTKHPYAILGQKLSGSLPGRNASLNQAAQALLTEGVEYWLHKAGKHSFWAESEASSEYEESYYRKHFNCGAFLVPRSFWFVEVKPSPLGFDPSFPPLETAEQARRKAKDPYKGLVMKGSVESRFLYATLLSTDLLPFGHLDYRLVVLPIELSDDRYRVINVEEAHKRGFLNLAQWLVRVEEEWNRRRGRKAESMNIYERLNQFHTLTKQVPKTKYRVLYPMSATYLCASAVKNEPIEFDIGGQKVRTRGFVADYKSFYIETQDLNEASYLVSILNAPLIDSLIKPMQSRGQFGPRDICKKVLEFPIPQFNASDPPHLELAVLGKKCDKKVADWIKAGGPGKIRSIGRLRTMVREMLAEELKEIDKWVKEIMEL